MTSASKSSPLPGATGGPDIPADRIPGTGGTNAEPGRGGRIQPEPNPSGIPGRAGEGEDKGDLAPSPDHALNDIKKGSR